MSLKEDGVHYLNVVDGIPRRSAKWVYCRRKEGKGRYEKRVALDVCKKRSAEEHPLWSYCFRCSQWKEQFPEENSLEELKL